MRSSAESKPMRMLMTSQPDPVTGKGAEPEREEEGEAPPPSHFLYTPRTRPHNVWDEKKIAMSK